MQVVNAVENLIQQGLNHSFVHHNLLLVRLSSTMELDNVPQVVF